MYDIHLIVSCSQQKSFPGDPAASFRKTKGKKLETKLNEWVRTCNRSQQRKAAIAAYNGQYWCVIRDILDLCRNKGIKTKLSIVSAGFGLLKGRDLIPNYTATFQKGSADSVVPESLDSSERANYLSDWFARTSDCFWGEGRLRGFRRLEPNTIRIYLLSPEYISAISKYLQADTSKSVDRQIIFGASDGNYKGFEKSIIPLNTDLQNHLGGSRTSLGARMAKDILNNCQDINELNPNRARTYFEKLAQKKGEKVEHARRVVDDDFVRKFIIRQKRKGVLTYSPMLRRLRDQGLACEMKRFRSIYNETINSNE